MIQGQLDPLTSYKLGLVRLSPLMEWIGKVVCVVRAMVYDYYKS